MRTYTNKNRFFGEQIDILLKDKLKKTKENTGDLCDIDYVYRFNHKQCKITSQLDRSEILGNKWDQYENYVNWCVENNKKKYLNFIPTTYKLDKRNLDKKMLEDLFKSNKKWIVKPINGSFRAGIHVVKDYKGLISWMNQYINVHWILQDYIDNPLKIENKKFHFRIYVLLIKTKNYSQVLIFNKGYMFLSQKEYDDSSLDDDSNLSGGDSKDVMRLYPNIFVKNFGYKNYKSVLKQINDIVKYTMASTIDKLTCVNSKKENYKCYKLLGYDILIDKDYKCHLGEINSRTVNVKFPIKDMYENLIKIILLDGPISNTKLFEENLNWYSVLKKIHNKKISEKK